MAKILIVEDDSDLVETYIDLLEAHEHTVSSASSIPEATKQVLEMQPEIITLDLNLIGSTGSAISNFINMTKKSSQSKIIIISGHPEMMSGTDSVEEVDLVLAKPVDNQLLMLMIDRLLKNSQ